MSQMSENKGGRFWTLDLVMDKYAPFIGPSAYMVYSALARMANRNCEVRLVMGKIMKRVNLSRNTVKAGIRTLSAYGLIEWDCLVSEDGDADGFLFRLLDPPPVAKEGKPQEFVENRHSHMEGVSDSDTGGVSDGDRGVYRSETEGMSGDDTPYTTTVELPSLEQSSVEHARARAAQTPPVRKGLGPARFDRPSIEQIVAYGLTLPIAVEQYKLTAAEITSECEAFFDYNESKGWKVGGDTMKSWQAALRTRFRNMEKYGTLPKRPAAGNNPNPHRVKSGNELGTFQEQMEDAYQRGLVMTASSLYDGDGREVGLLDAAGVPKWSKPMPASGPYQVFDNAGNPYCIREN